MPLLSREARRLHCPQCFSVQTHRVQMDMETRSRSSVLQSPSENRARRDPAGMSRVHPLGIAGGLRLVSGLRGRERRRTSVSGQCLEPERTHAHRCDWTGMGQCLRGMGPAETHALLERLRGCMGVRELFFRLRSLDQSRKPPTRRWCSSVCRSLRIPDGPGQLACSSSPN